MRPRREPTSQLGRRINDALGTRSVKWLATVLAQLSEQPIENTQSYVWRWWKTEGITDEWAERLAVALEKPPDYFRQSHRQRPSAVLANGRETNRLLRALEDVPVDPEVVAVLTLLARRLDALETLRADAVHDGNGS
jgi:hypothetical protein